MSYWISLYNILASHVLLLVTSYKCIEILQYTYLFDWMTIVLCDVKKKNLNQCMHVIYGILDFHIFSKFALVL